eukprot:1250508-Rhodomonas_salina.1
MKKFGCLLESVAEAHAHCLLESVAEAHAHCLLESVAEAHAQSLPGLQSPSEERGGRGVEQECVTLISDYISS